MRPYHSARPGGRGEDHCPTQHDKGEHGISSLPDKPWTATPTGDNPACCSSSRGLVERSPQTRVRPSGVRPSRPCCGAPLAPPAFLLLYPISGAPRRRRSTQQPALLVMLPKSKDGDVQHRIRSRTPMIFLSSLLVGLLPVCREGVDPGTKFSSAWHRAYRGWGDPFSEELLKSLGGSIRWKSADRRLAPRGQRRCGSTVSGPPCMSPHTVRKGRFFVPSFGPAIGWPTADIVRCRRLIAVPSTRASLGAMVSRTRVIWVPKPSSHCGVPLTAIGARARSRSSSGALLRKNFRPVSTVVVKCRVRHFDPAVGLQNRCTHCANPAKSSSSHAEVGTSAKLAKSAIMGSAVGQIQLRYRGSGDDLRRR